jgi:DNA-binding winged helix-turn-helix (wHTH) protein/TolB-like protein
VGRFTLHPFRQLLESDRLIPVKPKALAILSVLAQAEGALVTKEELLGAVWPNVTVEDNAIQAHVASLRKILGHDAELLSTVHGQGYRLAPTGDTPSDASRSKPMGNWAALFPGRRQIVLSVLAILLCFGVAGLWLFRHGAMAVANPPAQIAVVPFDLTPAGPEAIAFGNDLRDKISADLLSMQILTVTGGGRELLSQVFGTNRAVDSEFQLSGRIASDGTMQRIRVQLMDTREGVAVWSGTFQKSISDRKTLLPIVSTAVADAAHFAIIGRMGKVRLNAAGIAALIEARDSITAVSRPNPNLQMADYKKIIAATPEFSWAHSGLAVADAFQLRSEPSNELLRKEIRTEANRALELEPANGEAYLALEVGLPRFDWQQRESLLLKGNKADPGFGPIPVMEGRLTAAVGRNQDSLFWLKRAYNIDPLHNSNTFDYVVTLLSEGHPAESERLLAEMDAQWPQHSATRNAHFWTSVISGATKETLAIVMDPSRWPVGMNEKSADVWRAALMAHDSKEGGARAQAIASIKNASAEGSLTRGDALLLLSILSDVDGAFDQAGAYLPADPQWGPVLFLGPTLPMRQDPRFISLAVKFGFAAYWRSTGQWPDFCKAPDLPYDCKKEVANLALKNPALSPMPETHAPIPN